MLIWRAFYYLYFPPSSSDRQTQTASKISGTQRTPAREDQNTVSDAYDLDGSPAMITLRKCITTCRARVECKNQPS